MEKMYLNKWLSEQILEPYKVSQTEKGWKFQQKYVLIDTDHSTLITEIDTELKRYEIYSIEYDPKTFQQQIKLMVTDMLSNEETVQTR